jgi:hypothetical protein
MNWRGLAEGRGLRQLVIVFIVVEDGSDKGPLVTDGLGEIQILGVALALQHQVAELGEDTGILAGDESFGKGDGNFGAEAKEMVFGGFAGGRGEIADEIGAAKAAAGGVGMGVAESAGEGGGESAAASIGEEAGAAGRRRVGEEPFGRLRVDILGRMSSAEAEGKLAPDFHAQS